MAQDHATAEAIRAAQGVLDAFMTAFNARDLPAFEASFNFPHVRFASGKVTTIMPGDMKPAMFTTGSLAEWDHSDWQRRSVIHAGADKVHIDTHFAASGRTAASWAASIRSTSSPSWTGNGASRGGRATRRSGGSQRRWALRNAHIASLSTTQSWTPPRVIRATTSAPPRQGA